MEIALRPEQLSKLADLARDRMGGSPIGALIELADKWGISFAAIAKAYTNVSVFTPATHNWMPQSSKPRKNPNNVRKVAPPPLLHNVHAAPGTTAEFTRGWSLLDHVLNSGFSPSEIKDHTGIKPAELKRMYNRQQNPTSDQAARLSALLQVPIEDMFIGVCPEPENLGDLKGLSALGLLRVHRHLTPTQLKHAIAESGGAFVRNSTIIKIERGTNYRGLTLDEQHEAVAIATYFSVPPDNLFRRFAPGVIAKLTEQNRSIHRAMLDAHFGMDRSADLLTASSIPELMEGGKPNG